MGSIYEVTCTACDYRATVYEGAGMESVIAPAVCPQCRELRDASRPVFLGPDLSRVRDGAEVHCEVCGTKLQPWRPGGELTEPSFGQLTTEDTLTTGPCPRCGSPVEAHETGLWD